MSDPRVSVIVPLYQKGPYVARTLESILAQTLQDFELIVIDDGSVDEGAEVVASFDDPRIRLVRQENRGLSNTRNRGAEMARSEAVAYLDADDQWKPTFLETVMDLRDRFPDAGFWATRFDVITHAGNLHEPQSPHLPERLEGDVVGDFFKTLEGSWPVWIGAILFHRTRLLASGGFNPHELSMEDIDVLARLALAHPVALSPRRLSIYRRDAGNHITRQIRLTWKTAYAGVLERAIEARNFTHTSEASLRTALARHYAGLASNGLRAGEYSAARRFAWLTRVDPTFPRKKRLALLARACRRP